MYFPYLFLVYYIVKYITLFQIHQWGMGGIKRLVAEAQNLGAIPKSRICPKCGSAMTISFDEMNNSAMWYCGGKLVENLKQIRRRKRISVRVGTFFERSNLSFTQIFGFVNLWVSNVPLKIITRQMGISHSTSVDWNSFCYEVVRNLIYHQVEPLGGEGKIVEIDECKMGKRK